MRRAAQLHPDTSKSRSTAAPGALRRLPQLVPLPAILAVFKAEDGTNFENAVTPRTIDHDVRSRPARPKPRSGRGRPYPNRRSRQALLESCSPTPSAFKPLPPVSSTRRMETTSFRRDLPRQFPTGSPAIDRQIAAANSSLLAASHDRAVRDVLLQMFMARFGATDRGRHLSTRIRQAEIAVAPCCTGLLRSSADEP